MPKNLSSWLENQGTAAMTQFTLSKVDLQGKNVKDRRRRADDRRQRAEDG